ELAVRDRHPCPPVFEYVVLERPLRDFLRLDRTLVQEAEVDRVVVTLQRLKPVALGRIRTKDVLALGQHVRFELRQRRWYFPRPHIDPDEAAPLLGRVRRRPDLALEV